MKKVFAYINIGIILISLFSCEENNNANGVPLVQVNHDIYVNDPAFFKLSVVGGWEYVNAGSRGIIIYRKSNEEFLAFDRHCPYQPSDPCGQVSVDASEIVAVDSCCMSEYVLVDGYPINGPATFPLKQYRTTFDNTVLRIFN